MIKLFFEKFFGKNSKATKISNVLFLSWNTIREFFSTFFVYEILPLSLYEISYNKISFVWNKNNFQNQRGALTSLIISYLVLIMYMVEFILQIEAAKKFIKPKPQIVKKELTIKKKINSLVKINQEPETHRDRPYRPQRRVSGTSRVTIIALVKNF